MMAMHCLGLLQVLVRQMELGANHQNAEVHVHIHFIAYIFGHVTCIPYINTGVNIGADMPILIGGSVTITCTTDSPADSIMLFQDDQPLHGTVMQSTTILTYTISLVSDSIHGNTFKCEALLANISDTAFDIVIISLDGKTILIAYGFYLTLSHSSPTTNYR